MLYPNVVGQSGTARPAPVLVTSPPAMIRNTVATMVTTANQWAIGSVSSRSCPHAGRGLRLGQEVPLRLRGAVLVGPSIHRGQRRPPVEVRGRRWRRPL